MNPISNFKVSRILSLAKFYLTLNCLLRTVIVFISLFLITVSVILYTPSRNAVLGNSLPGVWRDVDTTQLLKIHRLSQPISVGKCPERCDSMYRPKTRLADIEKRGVKFYDDIKYDPQLYKNNKWMFLPLMTRDEKRELLHILDVMGEVLTAHRIPYFLVDGTLLGVVRHRGIIPWDDDIDVALNGSDWQRVKAVLCCVEGYSLIPRNYMHWKFIKNSNSRVRNTPEFTFPFIDMFFYMEDDDYIWSITQYNIQNLVARKDDVFPLTTAELDGNMYPVPRRFEHLVRTQFRSLRLCVSPGMFHKFNHPLRGKEKAAVPCHSLSDLYTFYV